MAESVNLLEQIRAQVPVAIQAAKTAGASNVAAQTGIAKSQEASATILREAATDQALVVQTAELAGLNAQNAARRAYVDSGAQDALLSIIDKMVAEVPTLDAATEALRQEELAASGFNIISSIKFNTDWSGNRARAQGAANRITTLSAAAQKLDQAVSSVGQQSRHTAETITTATVAAKSRLAASALTLKALEADREVLRHNGLAVDAAANAEDRVLSLLATARNVQTNEERLDHERIRLRMQQDAMAQAKQEKLTEQQETQEISYYISLGNANRGGKPYTPSEVSTAVKLFKTGQSAELKDLYDAGRETATNGRSRLTYSAASAASLISRGQLVNVPEERQKALKIVERSMIELNTLLTDPKLKPKAGDLGLLDDPKGVNAAKFINRRSNELLTEYGNLIGNNADNPRNIGDLSSYIGTATSPGVSTFQNYPLTRVLLNPQIAAGVPLTDPSQVFKQTMAAVRGDKISMNQAASDFANIYQRANRIRLAELGFDTIGITAQNEGTYYIEVAGKKVNAASYDEVLRAMVNEQAAKMFAGSVNPFVIGANIGAQINRGAEELGRRNITYDRAARERASKEQSK